MSERDEPKQQIFPSQSSIQPEIANVHYKSLIRKLYSEIPQINRPPFWENLNHDEALALIQSLPDGHFSIEDE